MAETSTTTTIYLFCITFSLSFLPSIITGFRLKLIHRDSPLSPLYQPNLTDLERLTKNAEISKARASYFRLMDNQNSSLVQDATIRLPMKSHEPVFTVEVGIGTPPVKRTLIFDTGSGLTWTQCRPCLKCYKQNEPLFNPKKSSSYKSLPKKHPFSRAFTCTPFGCAYKIAYYSGQFSAGPAAMENFTFLTDVGANARVSNLVFGCGTLTRGNFPKEISGIMGFDKEPYSMARQLGSFIKGRFSYCLSALGPDSNKASYVRFGDEAVIRARYAQKIPFLNYKRSSIIYGVNLNDLSIEGQKLGLGNAAFPDGCFVDSGASVSLLNKRAFSAVTNFLDKYFAKFKDVRRYIGKKAQPFHCYTRAAAFRSFPTLTYHFQGADYQVPYQSLFLFMEGNMFCLAMMESRDTMLLGAYQQRNMRFLYDLTGMMLSFAPEDCSRDSA